MVSSLNFAYLHLRLEELFDSNDWFGGLFVGDILQLQPVNGSPVFERVTQKSLTLGLGCAASINIWRRQKSDQGFSLLLDCVRRGCSTDETLSTLKQRVIQVSVVDKLNYSFYGTRSALILDKLIHRIAMALASGDRVNSIGAYLRLTTLIACALQILVKLFSKNVCVLHS